MAASFWIVHRDPRWREALRRLVGGAPLLGDPTDPGALADAPAPRAVLLGAAGDFEAELAWAHRAAERLAREAGARGVRAPLWLIFAEPEDEAEAQRLFDGLPAVWLPLSGDATDLRRRIRAALVQRGGAALSERRQRDRLDERFERWLGDLDAPGMLAAIDPGRRSLPLLVRGEPGTGRGLLARYLHLQAGAGGAAAEAFASVACEPELAAGSLLAGLVAEIGAPATAARITVCVEDADALAPAAQRRLARWIEEGLPIGALRGARVRWMATAGDPAREDRLVAELADALAGLVVHIPPLRDHPAAIDRIAEQTARAWAALRAPAGVAARAPLFSDDALAALRGYAWPGNARELEAVVRRTLALTRREPIEAADLVFDGPGSQPEPGMDDAELDAPRRVIEPHRDEPEALRTSQQATRPEEGIGSEPPTGSEGAPEAPLRRLAGAVAHEVGNPLVGLRTFAQMLPSRFDDPEFRAQFAERVEADTRRIEAVVDTLARLGSLPPPARTPVDVSGLLARLLQLQRGRIQERRVVVLEELDREHPEALGDAEQLRFALGLLLEEAISWLPEHGDLYVATTHRAAEAGRAAPRLRILLRSRGGSGTAPDIGLRLAENTLAVAAVEAVVRAHGGSLAVEPGEPGETLVVIDLPAA